MWFSWNVTFVSQFLVVKGGHMIFLKCLTTVSVTIRHLTIVFLSVYLAMVLCLRRLHHHILRPRQDGCRFPDDILRCIFLNENSWILSNISLKFVPRVPINNIPALVQIMAWRRPGAKPLSEPMMVRSPTHICALGLNLLTYCGGYRLSWVLFPPIFHTILYVPWTR